MTDEVKDKLVKDKLVKDKLSKLSLDELVTLNSEMLLPSTQNRAKLMKQIKDAINAYEQYEKEKNGRYEEIKQLGDVGKEGLTLLVRDTQTGKRYAMKTFRSNKSSDKLKEEVDLQNLAAKAGVSPKIIDYDTVTKFVVMDLMDGHLYDEMKKNNYVLNDAQQLQIIDIFRKLDKSGVFHGDANIQNYMIKRGKIYMIDFGYAKHITLELKKKLKSENLNMEIMLLGLILKLRELKCPPESYNKLKTFLSEEKVKHFNL